MIRITKISIIALLVTASAHAEVIRKECQTEESRTLRLTSEAFYKAATESEPFRGCNGCSMPSAQVDIMRATVERFRSEARINILKARALEAARCPHWERAIMDVLPATEEEREAVISEFQKSMAAEESRLATLKKWKLDHPQCKHVVWWRGSDGGSKEDFSGKFEGKAGQCSADSNGEAWVGNDDSLKMHDPETNPLIAQVRCEMALSKYGFSDNRIYAEQKFCQ